MDEDRLPPPLDEAEFTQLAQGLVDDTAPKVFALLAEEGDREDGHVAMWGLAFDDHAVLVGAGDRIMIMRCSSAEAARRRFAQLGPTRLIWAQPPTS